MDLEFLWLSSINNYNNRIGNVDIANQNRSSYRLDRFMKKMKWQQSIWIWDLCILLVYYIIYIIYLEDNNIPKKNILSQYNLRKAIALIWINRKNYQKSNERKSSVDKDN